jgi:dipeptidyl aminopeptidase/acylaminoacyl peptidase
MAGPVSYVGSGQPPFLIIPSDQDQVVPYTQSVELAEKLPGAGNPASLLVVKNSDHGFTRSAPRSTRL